MFFRLSADISTVVSFFNKTNFLTPLAKILDRFGLNQESPDHKLAKKILEEYGQNSLEYFKLGKDKSFYFSKTNKSFIAYRVFGRGVVVLGDPVGPYQEIEPIISSFHQLCKNKNQSICFFQTSALFIDTYKKLGFHVTSIGNEGLVNLPSFNLNINLREKMRELDALRYKVRYYKNPNDKQLLEKLRKVSNDWLSRGQKEKTFSLGSFSEDYIKTTTVMTVEDMVGNVVAFINLIPSYKKNDMAIDLMRDSSTAPEGTIEYLLTHTILFFRELAYQRLSFGLVPIASSQNKSNLEEAVTKTVLAKMSFLFNDLSLKAVKEKFIDILEPRYFTISKKQQANTKVVKINDNISVAVKQ